MQKGVVFEFTAPNGAVVTAVCVATLDTIGNTTTYLGYAQNRLFKIIVTEDEDSYNESIGEVLVEYCILPEYDEQLKYFVRIED